MGNKKDSIKRPNKVVALITYIIALIALLLGLFLPYGPYPALNGTTDAIWAFQLPQALKAAVPVQAVADLIGDVGNTFTFPLSITLNGTIDGGYDLGALFTVLYALVVLAGLVALIPAIVSACSKKSKKNTALNAASFIEVVAFLFVSIFVFIQLSNFTLLSILPGITVEGDYQWSYPLLGAFGGTFLMLVIQSIFYRKGSGVFKFVLLLLSTLALMLVVYDVGAIIPSLQEPLTNLVNDTGFAGKLYHSETLGSLGSVVGILPVLLLFCGSDGITFTALLDVMTAAEQTLFICTLILSLLVLINFLLDAMGLGKTTKRYMLVCNLVRYSLEVVAAALVIILPLCIDTATPGLMSIVVAVLALVALILNIIRLVRFDRRIKKIRKAVAAEKQRATQATEDKQPEEQPQVEEEKPYVYTPPVFAKEEEPKDEPEVYNPVIYNGPTDEFINTLSTEQKIEFSKVFLERQCGNLGYIPDYNVGGKNDRFFNNVFIYFARLRTIVSDGLFNKMYEYGNLM